MRAHAATALWVAAVGIAPATVAAAAGSVASVGGRGIATRVQPHALPVAQACVDAQCARARAAPRAVARMASTPPPPSDAQAGPAAGAPPSAAPRSARRGPPSPIWELDLYTRPVTNDMGKKLWELLVCDSNGVMRHVEPLPSSLINSRELRKRVQALIDRAEVRPTQVRFFRSEMQSMIGVALSELPVLTVPTRRTYELRNWLEQRYGDTYPTMPGYNEALAEEERARPALDRVPTKMPDALRGDKWVFVNLPVCSGACGGGGGGGGGAGRVAEACAAHGASRRPPLQPHAARRSPLPLPCDAPGCALLLAAAAARASRAAQISELRGPKRSIDASNIGFGTLFSVDDIDLPDDTPIPGLLITSGRAEPLAAWMSGTELASISVNLEGGDLLLEVGIDTQYMFAKLWDLKQREEVRSAPRRAHAHAPRVRTPG